MAEKYGWGPDYVGSLTLSQQLFYLEGYGTFRGGAEQEPGTPKKSYAGDSPRDKVDPTTLEEAKQIFADWQKGVT